MYENWMGLNLNFRGNLGREPGNGWRKTWLGMIDQ